MQAYALVTASNMQMQTSAAKRVSLVNSTRVVQHHNKHSLTRSLTRICLSFHLRKDPILSTLSFPVTPPKKISYPIGQPYRLTCPNATGVPHTPSFRAKITEVRAYLSSIAFILKRLFFSLPCNPQGSHRGDSSRGRHMPGLPSWPISPKRGEESASARLKNQLLQTLSVLAARPPWQASSRRRASQGTPKIPNFSPCPYP